MPTFTDSIRDAADASEALRGLAHASRTFERPEQMYDVLGDLLAGARSLTQILDQLATAHANGRSRAFDDHGDHDAGARDALAAADELHQAATLIDAAHDRLDTAMSAAGRIAWHDAPAVDQRRWVSVVFLQGEEADQVLDMIQRDGPAAGIEHLRQWDHGEETTGAALENGYVYDEPPVGRLDRSVTDGGYTLTYSPFLGHVSLLRAHDAPDADDLAPASRAAAVPARGTGGREPGPDATGPAATGRTTAAKDWFATASPASRASGRGLGL